MYLETKKAGLLKSPLFFGRVEAGKPKRIEMKQKFQLFFRAIAVVFFASPKCF